jgi:hypothetical protein
MSIKTIEEYSVTKNACGKYRYWYTTGINLYKFNAILLITC